jgi:hypothetical protein
MKSKPSSPRQSTVRSPAWQKVYEATLQETDAIALFKLVEIAEATILTHRDTLANTSRTRGERRAIEHALQVLLVIKQARLSFPGEMTWSDQRVVHNGERANQ